MCDVTQLYFYVQFIERTKYLNYPDYKAWVGCTLMENYIQNLSFTGIAPEFCCWIARMLRVRQLVRVNSEKNCVT